MTSDVYMGIRSSADLHKISLHESGDFRYQHPKSKDCAVEALRVLRVTRAHAVRERRSALQRLRILS